MPASDEANLEEKLRAIGYWPLEVEQEILGRKRAKPDDPGVPWLNWFGKARRRDLIDFCTIMSFQTKVGIPLIQALHVARQDCENERFGNVLKGLQRHIEGGLLFHEALEKYPKTFSLHFISVIRAGELSSRLPETFLDLKNYLEWVENVIAEVRQASLYPLIVMTVVGGFVLFLFSYIIPQFAALLKSTNAPLPLITQIIFGVSDFAKATWWFWGSILIFCTLGIMIGRRISKRFAIWVDSAKIKLPIFGELNLMLSISRFTHNLSILYRSGIPIIQAFHLCEELVGNAVVEKAVAESEESLKGGEIISEAMRRHDVFPSMLMQMVIMGETTGNLDAALDNVADYYNQIIPRRIKKIFTILEPALIVFLIFVVGAVALAIFLPIISLMGSISKR